MSKLTKKVMKSDIKELNKIRFSSKFHGAMAVDVDLDADVLTIGYVSAMGKTYSAEIKYPTFEKVGDALVELTTAAHEASKKDLKKNGDNLILKAISSRDFRTPLTENLAKSSKDVKIARDFQNEFAAVAARKLARISELTKELAELEA